MTDASEPTVKPCTRLAGDAAPGVAVSLREINLDLSPGAARSLGADLILAANASEAQWDSPGPAFSPDCRDSKHTSCVGGLCECGCHEAPDWLTFTTYEPAAAPGGDLMTEPSGRFKEQRCGAVTATDRCLNCNRQVFRCSEGCWHHTDERGSIFCTPGQVPGVTAEPKGSVH